MKKTFLLWACVLGVGSAVQAQEHWTLDAGGGDGTGTGGTVAYSIGQLVVDVAGSNYTVAPGVQQAREVNQTLEVISFEGTSIRCVLSPNPVQHQLTLSLSQVPVAGLRAQVCNLLGACMADVAVEQTDTQIATDSWAAATYIVRLYHNNQTLNTFKIVKN